MKPRSKRPRRRGRDVKALKFSVYINLDGRTGKVRCRQTGVSHPFHAIDESEEQDAILQFMQEQRDVWVQAQH